ncbi:MAG: GHKL domain-containing protein, partial [Legionellales bacterium]|nr:GHKL domain-containing protein [Legionellales bacterium]
HEIALTRDYGDDIPFLSCSSQEMEQLIVNLLSNARYSVEAMKNKMGKNYKMQITIRLKYLSSEKQILIEVGDNGVGMSKEVQERCMDPFFTTKPVGEGTGLGLSIILGIVKGVDGTFLIESEVNKGAVFRVFLPCAS